ncbi:MAG: hypothetical protein C4297_05870 [Gemmataceae bacterium]
MEFKSYSAVQWGVGLLVLFSLTLALHFGQALFLPLVIALMLATVLWPPVQYLTHRFHLPRSVSSVLVILALVLVSAVGILGAVVAVQDIVSDLLRVENQEKYYRKLREAIASINIDLANQLLPVPPPRVERQEGKKEGQEATVPRDSQAAAHTQSSVTGAGGPTASGSEPPPSPGSIVLPEDPQLYRQYMENSVLFTTTRQFLEQQANRIPEYLRTLSVQVVLILFLVLFLCVDGEVLIHRTVEIFGPSTGPDGSAAARALREMARHIRSYLVWRTVIIVGMVIVLGFLWKLLGLKQPWLWAVVAGILTFIPYLGPIIAGIPPVLDALVTRDLNTAAMTLLLYTIVIVLEGYVAFPLVLGRQMEMNATTILIACLFWYIIWGEIGLFLALPLMAGIKAICQNVPGWQPWANLMGSGENKNAQNASVANG